MAPAPHAVRARVAGASMTLHEDLTDAQLDDLRNVVENAQRLLTGDSVPVFGDIYDFDTASSALAAGWRLISGALSGDGVAAAAVAGAHDLTSLLTDVTRAEAFLTAAQLRSRERSVRLVSQALDRLQEVTAVSRLIDVGAEAVCSLGFDRAIVSRIEDSTWMTEAVHVDGDSEWAGEILAAGRQHPQTIAPGLPEQDIVRRRRPVLVTSVQERDETHVHKAVADTSQSRSYVAAPIMPRSSVIGFLHGDRFFHRGDVSQFDRDVLGLFARGYGFALERALLLERLDRVQDTVRSMSQHITTLVAPDDGGRWGEVPAAATTFSRAPVLQMREDPRDDDTRLTRREVEVLRLMASGDTNVRIAHKLIISEGTVKSHVKHILRKLSAANRAEAVARWHSAQSDRS